MDDLGIIGNIIDENGFIDIVMKFPMLEQVDRYNNRYKLYDVIHHIVCNRMGFQIIDFPNVSSSNFIIKTTIPIDKWTKMLKDAYAKC